MQPNPMQTTSYPQLSYTDLQPAFKTAHPTRYHLLHPTEELATYGVAPQLADPYRVVSRHVGLDAHPALKAECEYPSSTRGHLPSENLWYDFGSQAPVSPVGWRSPPSETRRKLPAMSPKERSLQWCRVADGMYPQEDLARKHSPRQMTAVPRSTLRRQLSPLYRDRAHPLLPPCVARHPFSGDEDLSAYAAATLPTTSAYVDTMGMILRHIVDRSPTDRGVRLRFDAVSVPDVSINDYLERLRRFFSCSPECFVLAMIYIDRLVRLHDGRVVLCSLNIHRILLTAVTLAAKYFDDVYYSNSFYAKIGGLSGQEMNVLESHFLNLIKYNLYVSPREYERYRRDVTVLHAATNAGVEDLQRPHPALKSDRATRTCHDSDSDFDSDDCAQHRSTAGPQVAPVSISSTQCSTPSESEPDGGASHKCLPPGNH